MAWRIAESLKILRAQVDARWPYRNKASDGSIGDASHSSRSSDHNPNSAGVVCAIDITHDPANGANGNTIAEAVKDDSRVKYVIWNRLIWNPSISKVWREYKGSNPHTKHVHVSVLPTKDKYDDTTLWTIPHTAGPVNPVKTESKPTLKRGSKGQYVRDLQAILGITVDGDFGPKTEAAVRAFQARTGLVVDGKVGAYTWAELASPVKSEAPMPPLPVVVPSWPQYALKFFKDAGWSDVAARALTASLIWESGGNVSNPDTIRWDAVGDRGKSHGAGQWQGARWSSLQDHATKKGKPYTDPDVQLSFMDNELHTTERRAANALRAATTIEEANAAAIKYWRPSTPHADRRLAIAKGLL
jgi:hypothetical protein